MVGTPPLIPMVLQDHFVFSLHFFKNILILLDNLDSGVEMSDIDPSYHHSLFIVTKANTSNFSYLIHYIAPGRLLRQLHCGVAAISPPRGAGRELTVSQEQV